jgi:hypothetical protein
MFVSGLIVGMSVSLLTVVILKLFKQDRVLDGQKYKIEIKSGRGYHSGYVEFNKVNKRGIKK